MINSAIKIILAILFFICLLDMPYSYFQFVRFAALVGFAFLSYKYYESGNKSMSFVCAALAILFQPLFKIAFGRTLWNIVDVVIGILLIISLFYKPKNINKK
ncbi:MAG: DUF6804 family protein [Bacteroidota bacterium]